MLLTIFTPTYNRKSLLPRVYNSLKKQTKFDFEWLIVDDGSTDNTEKIVKDWIASEDKFPIRYIYQENRGKAMAHNTGVNAAKGLLFFCLDSDDMLTPNAVSVIYNEWENIKDNASLSGIVALKCDTNGESIGKLWPKDFIIGTLNESSTKYRCPGERSLVYKTDILKQYLFPEIPSHKFLIESIIYNRIDRKYKMLYVPITLQICEYQPDGYSQNLHNIILKNPIGFKLSYAESIDLEYYWLDRVKAIIMYHIFSRLAKEENYSYHGKHTGLVRLLSPLGYLGLLAFKLKLGHV